ncbi:Tat pathway signal sequence domain protein [Streptomyces sp. NA02950]|uniref:Tat pathway signal sequence domain protein n=1 Tax=Streptomyces sp. NA02950 TaxID=2742137 RepID=UPI001592A7E2|nr:Tat pathway signal sequence domain protein [Streptomyces sp. NA02950]QKV92012.1 Tat pathway signal sequence domain protein [Streptomyces sp. NA02950]
MIHRHLGKVVAGAAVAVTAAAVMIGVTLPSSASGDEGPGGGGPQGSAAEQGQASPRPGVVESAPERGKKGTGRDPLTDDEMKRAQSLALSRGFRAESEDVKGKKGPEHLSTDLAELEPDEVGAAAPPRRADVTYYDYKDDTYVTKTVDLRAGKVEHTDTQRGVQPPPGHDEAVEAARLLINDKRGADLKEDFKDATGKTLTGPGQLTVTGFVYRAGEGNAGPAAVQDCGKHRCVRLFTRVVNGPWIDTRQLVIDLSDHSVARLG